MLILSVFMFAYVLCFLRDSFVLVGGAGTVVAHEEGGASYANYFKCKAPDRIRLLQMRSKRPYLFTGEPASQPDMIDR